MTHETTSLEKLSAVPEMHKPPDKPAGSASPKAYFIFFMHL